MHIAQNGVPVNGSVQVSGGGRSIEFIPDVSWTHDARIDVFVDSSATDLAGNALYNHEAWFEVIAAGDIVPATADAGMMVAGFIPGAAADAAQKTTGDIGFAATDARP